MRQSQTAVLERNTRLTGTFATEPFEAAWAAEARWFVQVLATEGDAVATLVTQISPDGLTWVDHDEVEHTTSGQQLTTWPVREFGQWLRVRGSVDGQNAAMAVRIYLAVKS